MSDKICKIYLFALLCLLSCNPSPKIEIDFSDFGNIQETVVQSTTQHKYLAVILTKNGCDACHFFKNDIIRLQKNNSLAPKRDFLIKTFDISDKGNFLLNQILREYAFPMTIVFDPMGNIKGIMKGGRMEKFISMLNTVAGGDIFYFTNKKPFLNVYDSTAQLADNQKVEFIDQMYKLAVNHIGDYDFSEEEFVKLKTLVKQTPYFYNKFLLTETLYKRKLDQLAKPLATQILTGSSLQTIDAILYQPMINDLRYISDNKYSNSLEPLLTTPQSSINFGKGRIGEIKNFQIPIKNIGKRDLVLSNVKVSCSCLNVDWPKEPIHPDSTNYITVKYQLNNEGIFNQSLFIFSNSPTNPLLIDIKGTVFIN